MFAFDPRVAQNVIYDMMTIDVLLILLLDKEIVQ